MNYAWPKWQHLIWLNVCCELYFLFFFGFGFALFECLLKKKHKDEKLYLIFDIDEPRAGLHPFPRCSVLCQCLTCFQCMHLRSLKRDWRYDMLRCHFLHCLKVPNDTLEIENIKDSDNKKQWSVTFLFYPEVARLPTRFWRLFSVVSWAPGCKHAKIKPMVTDWETVMLQVKPFFFFVFFLFAFFCLL